MSNNTKEIDNVLSVNKLRTQGIWDADNMAIYVEKDGQNFCVVSTYSPETFYNKREQNNDAPHEEAESNAKAICNAVNNTYQKGINPESVPLMLEALKGIMSIKGIEKYVTDYGLNLAKEAINKASL